MKTKTVIAIVLMISFLLMFSQIINADDDAKEIGSIEQNSTKNITIEVSKEYEVNQEIVLKTMPIIYSKQKGSITEGKITIIEELNDWYRISNLENEGWARKSNIQNAVVEENIENTENNDQKEETNTSDVENVTKTDNNEKEETTNTITEISKVGYVKADGLNIRKEPTTSSEAIHSLSFNSKITITGEVDGWYRINYEGKVGFVSQKYVSDTKLPENTSRGGVDRTSANEVNEKKVEVSSAETNDVNEEQEEEATTETVTGNQVVEYAKKYLGYKYVAGGSSPKGFDCSGFTTYVFKHFGISLNRASKGQIKNGVAVEKSKLQAGDLVIFNNESNSAIGHVGIYIGSGKFIHAANKKEGVTITELSMSYYSKRYVGARRVI